MFNPHNFYFTQIDINKNFDEDDYHYMNNTNKSSAQANVPPVPQAPVNTPKEKLDEIAVELENLQNDLTTLKHGCGKKDKLYLKKNFSLIFFFDPVNLSLFFVANLLYILSCM